MQDSRQFNMASLDRDLMRSVDLNEGTTLLESLTKNDTEKENTCPYESIQKKTVKEKVPEAVRLRTNDKERQRMHQLNTAMDNLRRVVPYSRSVNKLSKLSTLLLARKHIVSLQKTKCELHQLKEKILEQERKQDVSQMSMIQIPQGNIYQPWNQSFPVYVDRLDTGVNHVKTQQSMNRKLPLQNISNTKQSGQNCTGRLPLKFSIESLLS